MTDAGQTLTASNQISGGFALTKAGAGTLTLSGADTYSGATTVTGGTLTLSGASGAIASSSGVTIGGGGTLKLDNTASNNTNRVGAVGVTMNGGTFAFAHGADNTAYTETVGALSVNFGASTVSTDVSASAGSSILTFASLGRVAGAGATVNFGGGTGSPSSASNDNNVRFTTAPTLTNGIIGTWATVGGANWASYVSTGTASVQALATFSDVTRTNSGGTQIIPNTSTANVRIIEGTGTANPITLAAATTTINTLTQSTSGGTSAATIDLATRTLRVDGILEATGAGGLTIGTGTIANAGTLTRATTTAGGELIFQAFSTNALTINSVIADNTNLSNLTKAGSGTVFLNGANTYTGVTTIDAGIVNVATLSNYGVAGSLGNRALATEATTLVGIYLEGGTLQYTGSTAQSTDRNLRVGLNGGTIDASGGAGATMNFTHSGTNVDPWANPGSRTLTLIGTNTDNNTFAINLQEYNDGTSHTSLVKSGAGTWDLTNTHNSDTQTNSYLTFGGYGGGTTISGGTLGFANGAIGGGVVDITGNATLRWDTGNTQDITTGTGAGVARSVRIEDGVTATFNTNGNNVTLSNALQVGTLKTGAVTKDGAGTLTLTAANTYAGNTLVSGGKLLVNNTSGSGTGSGTVSVSSGATLGGTGSISGATTISGTHAPGVAGTPGTQTFGSSLAYSGGSIFQWDLNASTSDTRVGESYDKVVANGAVTGTSIFKIVLGTNAFTDAFWSTNKTWTDIFTGTGSYTLKDIFTSFSGTGIGIGGTVQGQGYNGLFTFQNGTNTLTWSPTGAYDVVPEPGNVLAGLLLAAGLLRRRRR